MRRPPKQEWFYRWRPLTFFPLLIFSDCFSLVLHLASVSVTTGSMMRYLDPTEVAQAVQFLQDGPSIYVPLPEDLLCLPAQSKEHGGNSRRHAVTLGELDRAVEGP